MILKDFEFRNTTSGNIMLTIKQDGFHQSYLIKGKEDKILSAIYNLKQGDNVEFIKTKAWKDMFIVDEFAVNGVKYEVPKDYPAQNNQSNMQTNNSSPPSQDVVKENIKDRDYILKVRELALKYAIEYKAKVNNDIPLRDSIKLYENYLMYGSSKL